MSDSADWDGITPPSGAPGNVPTKNLFDALTAELSHYCQQVLQQADRHVLTFPPSELDRLGHTLFTSLTIGGVCTAIIGSGIRWDPRSHYYESARHAARRGLRIQRVYLLPHRHLRHHPILQEHRRLDEAAGIETRALYVGHLISELSLPSIDSLDFGIWDDSVVCTALHWAGVSVGPSQWRVSRRPEDLQLARDTWTLLQQQGVSVPLQDEGEEHGPDLEEPMVTTASTAAFLSTVLCRGDHVSSEDCSWYHGVWQYLRILNMVSTPTWHTEFYLSALRQAAHDGSRRTLISGTADYSTLAHLLWAYDQEHKPCDVTVLDLCETPLLLCRWYGKLLDAAVYTESCDLLQFAPDQPFDLIVTDAFLTRFAPAVRREVVRRWAALLTTGGRVITTVRLQPGLDPNRPVIVSPTQVAAFRRRAYDESARWRGFLDMAPDDVAARAESYAERILSYPVGSQQQLASLFEEVGLHLDALEVADVPGEMAGTTYARVVARR